MVRRRVLQFLLLAVAVTLALGLAAPFVNAEGYRTKIQAALEGALGRKVKVGRVRFNLLTGPGFTVEGVEIADDPSMGIEPLAYVDTLEARVTLGTLWTQKLGFSNLKLKEPTLNLVKANSGAWNFQLLRASSGKLPSIQVREGRINFKFGDTKSVFYLSESDLDMTPLDDQRVDVRFAGQPARTDQAAQSFGMLLARGTLKRPETGEAEIDVNAEIERSAVSELSRLIEGHAIGLHGIVSSQVRVTGPISRLTMTGQLKLEDIHRWDLMPKGGELKLGYRGQLDLKGQRLEIETAESPGVPLKIRFRATELLSDPRWAASVDVHDVPASALVEAARHMGTALPETMQVEGKLNGAIGYSRPGGFQGQLSAADAVVKPPGAPLMKFRSANVVLEGDRLTVGPSTVETESGQTAELTADYGLASTALDVKIETAGMDAGELQKGTGVRVPVIGELEHGVWHGWLRYRKSGDEAGKWSGDFEVRDARMEVEGLAEPVRLASAAVLVGEDRVVVTKMRGRAGEVKFAGDYRWELEKSDRLNLDIAEVDLAQVEKILLPTLRRNQGLFARLRLRAAPLPDWLRNRRIEGTVKFAGLTVAGQAWSLEKARLSWNGSVVTMPDLVARHGDLDVEGQLTVNLGGSVPRYHAAGRVGEFVYKGGTLGVEGTVDTSGTGIEVAANAHGEGTFAGEDVAFSPEMEFSTIEGAFDWTSPAKVRVKSLQAGQGPDSYTGQGATQADGRLALELTSGKRQVKVAGTLFGTDVRP